MGCLKKLIYMIAFLMELYTFFGRIIYGGVYWGKLRYWNDGYSQTDHLWLIALLQWIFGIVLPIGSFIVNCMIIHSTRSSNCNPVHMIFPPDVAAKIAFKYSDFPSEAYYKERCSKPRKLFISFLVCGLVSSVIIVIYKVSEFFSPGDNYKDEAEDDTRAIEKDEENLKNETNVLSQ